MIKGPPRVDEHGRAFAGSQRQMQAYVNFRAEELSENILNVLPSLSSLNPSINWVSPLENDKYCEYQDKAFLVAVGLGHLSDALSDFWPKGGPVWDALASVDLPDNRGVLLVEPRQPLLLKKLCHRFPKQKNGSVLLKTLTGQALFINLQTDLPISIFLEKLSMSQPGL
ncbi:MAG: hypothetical protein JRJ65_18400 [Deltaproteobacteria bacterium]|nr:hypothetical protein [Deltaproteobacteria bacterium]